SRLNARVSFAEIEDMARHRAATVVDPALALGGSDRARDAERRAVVDVDEQVRAWRGGVVHEELLKQPYRTAQVALAPKRRMRRIRDIGLAVRHVLVCEIAV